MEIELIKIRNELRYGSRIYRLRKPKKGANFYVCKTVPFCYASINIALDENGIEDMTKVKINNNQGKMQRSSRWIFWCFVFQGEGEK